MTRRFLALAAMAVLAVTGATADTLIWDQPVNGLYTDVNKWFSNDLGTTGFVIPGPLDTVEFAIEGDYTITMTQDQEINQMFLDTGFSVAQNVTLDMGGFDFVNTCNNAGVPNNWGLAAGFAGGGLAASMTFANGTATIEGNILPFGTSADPITINIDNAALLNENFISGAEGYAWSRIGGFDDNTNIVNIENGGFYRATAFTLGFNGRPIGPGVDAVGTVNVDGNSAMVAGGQNVFGAGTGYVSVLGDISGVAADGGIESDAIGTINATNGGVSQHFALQLGSMQDFSDAPVGRGRGIANSDGAGSNIISDFNFTLGENPGGVGLGTASNGGQLTAAQPGFLGFIVGNSGEGKIQVTTGGKAIDQEQSSVGRFAGGVGEISVNGAGSLYQANSAFIGDGGTGTLSVTGGGHASVGFFTVLGNAATGVGAVSVTGAGSKFDAGGFAVGGSGAATVTIGSSGVVTADETDPSFVDVTLRGSISLSGGGSMTVGPGAAAAPVTTANTVTVIADGQLAGSGTINGNLANRGVVFGIDNLNVNGAYSQTSTGSYLVNVVADGVNSSMDVTGSAALAGDLFVNPDPGYVPAGLDSFLVMTYASRTGAFTSVTNRDLPGAGPGGIDLVFAHVQNATDYRLVVTVPGDYNLDGHVTGADYTIWADGFGDPNTAYNTGDGNADGQTTGADYTIWADHFGQNAVGPDVAATTPGKEAWDRLQEMGLARVPVYLAMAEKEGLSRDTLMSATGFGGHAVPEPSTWALGLLASLGLLAAARRRAA